MPTEQDTAAETDRATIAANAAAGLRTFAPNRADYPVMVGFDGFVDSIIDVVDKRRSTDEYDPIATLDAFGRRVQSAAGQSANFELATKLEKLGGNGPIMANALARFGLPVTFIGALGHPTRHWVFDELAEVATVHAIADPGYTDALEFNDGKLMLGKYAHLRQINFDRICKVIGEQPFIDLVTRARLLGMVNWTMLVEMDTIFDALIDRVLPQMPADADPPLMVIDLCDPAKRLTRDMLGALGRITQLNKHTQVVLGLNLQESIQIAQVLGFRAPTEPETSITETAGDLREALGVQGVVVHPRTSAAAAWQAPTAKKGPRSATNGEVGTGRFNGPFVQQPKLSTGAGDNFNAGFCLGMLADLPLPQALCVGTATSGYYVRHAQSPTLDQVADFCENMPDPEPAPARPGA